MPHALCQRRMIYRRRDRTRWHACCPPAAPGLACHRRAWCRRKTVAVAARRTARRFMRANPPRLRRCTPTPRRHARVQSVAAVMSNRPRPRCCGSITPWQAWITENHGAGDLVPRRPYMESSMEFRTGTVHKTYTPLVRGPCDLCGRRKFRNDQGLVGTRTLMLACILSTDADLWCAGLWGTSPAFPRLTRNERPQKSHIFFASCRKICAQREFTLSQSLHADL